MDKELQNKLRGEMIELAQMPLSEVQKLAENIGSLEPFKAAWVCVFLKASKGDMQAINFMQDHLMGKAVQRIQSESISYTYQDLLNRIKSNEDKYQIAIGNIPEPKTWTDLL